MKTKTSFGRVPFFIFLANLLAVYYSSERKELWRGRVKKEGGIIIYENPRRPVYSGNIFSMKEEVAIGKKESSEGYFFSIIRGVAVDKNNNIYVLDQKGPYVLVFNQKGEYLRTIGRKGQGPGELEAPLSLQLTRKEELLICDGQQERLVFYSLDGKHIRDIKAVGLKRIECIDSKNNIYSILINAVQANLELNKYDIKLNYIYSFGSCPFPLPDKFNPFLPVFSVAVRSDDYFVVGLPDDYELRIYTPEGKLSKIIRKKYDHVPITIEEIKKITNSRKDIYKWNFPKYHNPFAEISVDTEDRIFVKTYETAEEGSGNVFDVFDADGRFIAKIMLKKKLLARSKLTWKGDKLYTIEEDEDGFITIRRYRTKWLM